MQGSRGPAAVTSLSPPVQLEESEFTCAAAVKARKSMEVEIEDLHVQMEDISKAKQAVSAALLPLVVMDVFMEAVAGGTRVCRIGSLQPRHEGLEDTPVPSSSSSSSRGSPRSHGARFRLFPLFSVSANLS